MNCSESRFLIYSTTLAVLNVFNKNIDALYWYAKRSVLHELQSANVHISVQQVPILHTLKKIIVNNIVSETLLKNVWEDCDVDDVLYIFRNLQKRDIGLWISLVQFLHDRELGIREKHGIIIRKPVSDWFRATESISTVTRKMLRGQ